MRTLTDAWNKTEEWKTERIDQFNQNYVMLRLTPVLGEIYPLERDEEIGNSLTQNNKPAAFVGVYAGVRKYLDGGKEREGHVFCKYNSTTKMFERYFARSLDFFVKEQPALYVQECDKDSENDFFERDDIFKMLSNADLLP